jgi:hypothetical protein
MLVYTCAGSLERLRLKSALFMCVSYEKDLQGITLDITSLTIAKYYKQITICCPKVNTNQLKYINIPIDARFHINMTDVI